MEDVVCSSIQCNHPSLSAIKDKRLRGIRSFINQQRRGTNNNSPIDRETQDQETQVFTNQKGLQQFQLLLSSLSNYAEKKKKISSILSALNACSNSSFVYFYLFSKIIIFFLQTKTLLFQASCKETSRYTFCWFLFFLVKSCKSGQTAPMGPLLGGAGLRQEAVHMDNICTVVGVMGSGA